ncbi:MAG: amidohydrolase family protein [Candidatus Binatia bacterium]
MRAIDVHVHPSTRGVDPDAYRYFKRDPKDLPKTEDAMAALFAKHEVKALLIGWHPSTVAEGPRVTNQYVIDVVKRYPEAFTGVLASIEMTDAIPNLRRAEELAKDPQVKGFKFHPPDQAFYPNDRRYYRLWEVLQGSQKPVMFHTGFTVLGAAEEGGKGISLDFGRPIHLDTLAKDFPALKIIAAHPGWPWQEELIGIALHKSNIYVDTAGYLAEDLPDHFKRALRGRLQDRALFGTDFPYIDLDKAVDSFEKMGFKESVKEKILLLNARALFRL